MMKRDPEATRTAILDAAEDVFLQRGFGDSSMSEIAERAGVTKSLIHHHFGSKDGLWTAVKERRFIPYAERQLEMLKDAPASAELIRTSFDMYFRYMQENPQLVRILAWMFLEARPDEGCHPLDKRLMNAAAEKFREGQEVGVLRKDLDPRFILFVFVGLVQHWFQDLTHFQLSFDGLAPTPDLSDEYRKAALEIFLSGVGARS